MIDVKKKLSSFLPSSARAQLQNVLTVEWDTHKTVLVQVPGAAKDDGEMEMAGLTGREKYGRLADDDEDTEALFDQSNFDASHARWKANSSSASSSSREKSQKRGPIPPPLAPRPYDYAENPFDETSPTYRVQASQSDHSAWAYDSRRQAPGTPEQKTVKGWTTFEEDGSQRARPQQKKGVSNPWAAGGEWSQTPSPTSSRGTRESGVYETEDPFK